MGTAVVFALRELGVEVIPIPTPRVSVAWGSQLGDWQQVAGSASVLTPLVAALAPKLLSTARALQTPAPWPRRPSTELTRSCRSFSGKRVAELT